jgi:hypothetical protein
MIFFLFEQNGLVHAKAFEVPRGQYVGKHFCNLFSTFVNTHDKYVQLVMFSFGIKGCYLVFVNHEL